MTDREEPRREREDEDLPPPPVTRGRDRALWVGLFVIVGIVAVLLSLFTFTDAALFRGRYIITTYVSDAGGIRRGDPVQMRGVNIGRVQRFKISHENVAVRLEIEGEYDIPTDSKVVLKSAGLLGGLVADVVPGSSDKNVGNGDTLPGSIETGVSDVTSRLSNQAQTVLDRMQTLLDKPTIDNVHASSAELNQVLKNFSATVTEQRRELSQLTQSLRRSSASVEKITGAPEWDRTLKRVDALTERMDGVTANLDRSSRSMQTVLDRIERGEGTLGKMTKDAALYDRLSEAALNINQASANINKLADDIRRDPKRYLSIKVF